MFDVKPVTTDHATSCGPAALKMLLDYYGHEVPLETLIQECGPKVTGATMGDIKRAGTAHGLNMTAFRMSADDLLKLDRPAIIHWRFIHWVVFCGMNEAGEPVICNSSNGRYSVPVSYFRQFFTDYVLTNGTPDDLISEDYFDENAKAPDDYFDK